MRDLPPGMTMSLNLGGEKVPLGPSRSPESPGGGGEALESFRVEARKPLEIGQQVWMGRMAFQGMNDVAQDYGEARQWFERAARWGHGEALSTLGLMAPHGLGGPRDPEEAREWLAKAAGQGHAGAEEKLADLAG